MIAVSWTDAHFDFDGPEFRDDYLVMTIGFLVSETERFLSIAQEVLPNGDGYRAVTHIPREPIKKRVALTQKEDCGCSQD